MSEPNDPGKSEGGMNNERTVTDPVTHLPLTIHDATAIELERIPPPDEDERESDDRQSENEEADESNRRHQGVEKILQEITERGWWRDPGRERDRARMQTALVAGLAAGVGALGGVTLWVLLGKVSGRGTAFGWLDLLLAPVGCAVLGVAVVAASLSLRLFQTDPTPEPQRTDNSKPKSQSTSDPEPATWLNHLFSSLWPIVNPALLTPLSDMLEDALQSSLPKLIHGVRVTDLGQGSLPIRIIGVRALEKGSAAQDRDGMQAEEGDFVNLELALAYRARRHTSLTGRSGNAHLLLEMYTPNGLVLPVWVELTSFLASVRVRTQLTPNPPFLALTTLTLLGQPHLQLKCTPLAKNLLNVMDVPGLSRWVQGAIDAAVAEYVAPRSINLDLKALLMGEEGRDTEARGVVLVRVRSAWGFRMGDAGNVLKRDKAKVGDTYVTAGWGKWGKPLWTTRIIEAEPHPVWNETAFLLVGPAELHAQESLRLQLWDSDRFTADDHLGSIDVSLSSLMSPSSSPSSLNTISARTDSLTTDSGKPVPGKLAWEMGYFAKTTLEQHLAHDKKTNYEEIKSGIEHAAEEKLREAQTPGKHEEEEGGEHGEIEQQKKEDLKEQTDGIISSSVPKAEWPSGILSIRIEQIYGLEVRKIRGAAGEEEDDAGHEEGEGEEDLPSAYCTIVINQERVYKTRRKMKSGNPFFNAHTEKFIRSWPDTTLLISVRDSRPHEADPILGVLCLPLADLFKHQSLFTGSLPLVGGIGFGRVKLVLGFRSVQLRLPKEMRGWGTGRVQVKEVRLVSVGKGQGEEGEMRGCRLVLRTGCVGGKGKMYPAAAATSTADGEDTGHWEPKHNKPLHLPTTKRYSTPLVLQLRKHVLGPDRTVGVARVNLAEVPDGEEVEVEVPLRRGGGAEGQGEPGEDAEGGEQRHAEEGGEEPSDADEILAHLRVTLRFCPGLSAQHKKLARKNRGISEVMEALECARESREAGRGALVDELGGESENESDSSSSSSSSSSLASSESEGEANSEGESPGKSTSSTLISEVKGYRKRKDDLHRKHRGVMQWGGVRKATWVGKSVGEGAEKVGEKVKSAFKHRAPEVGIEKEV